MKKPTEVWVYEYATAIMDGKYYGWVWGVDFFKPVMPEGSLRNISSFELPVQKEDTQ